MISLNIIDSNEFNHLHIKDIKMWEEEIKLQNIWEDLDVQQKSWDQAVTDISKLFREWQPTQKEFLDRIAEFIKSWKDDDVIRLVKWYYLHQVWSVRFWVEIFKELMAWWYLDVINWKDPKCYMSVPLLVESALLIKSEALFHRHTYGRYHCIIKDDQIDKLCKLF